MSAFERFRQHDSFVVVFDAVAGHRWLWRGKRGRVVHMLASYPDGVTQHDTLPWHTRLGGTIHALRKDGLEISTELEGEYRHARYRLITPGTVTVGAGLRPGA